MNDSSWINDIEWQNLDLPTEPLENEEIYTLKIGDLLQMPEVDFKELASFDPSLRALMN